MINYSFIIPHHNCPLLLNRLLGTIPVRDDIEIIVVDDNSDCDKKPYNLRDGVKLINLEANESKGAGHARNVGLDVATGKWLLFADSDDYYLEGFISDLDQYVDSNADIILFSAFVDYKQGDLINDKERNYIENTFDIFYNSPKNQIDIKKVACTVNVPWNKMYSHNFINEIGNRFEEIPISNDAWFVKNAGVNCKEVEILDKRLYFYVCYTNSITSKRRPLKHYYQAIDSNTRRNILLRKHNLCELIEFPGFNKHNILRDFGRAVFVRLFVYKLFTDPTYLKAIYTKLKRRD